MAITGIFVLWTGLWVALPTGADASRDQSAVADSLRTQQPSITAGSPDAAEQAVDRPEGEPCDDPQQSIQRADLCQQWRMAEATQAMADTAANQWWLTFWEVIVVALAGGIALWAGRQAKRAADAAEGAIQQMQSATQVARDSAIAAQQAADASVAALKSDRAWVTFTEHEVRARIRKGSVVSCQIRIGWRNTAKTPARDATIAAGDAIRHPPSAPMPTFATNWEQHRGRSPIGPNVVMWGDPTVVEAGTLRDILAGTCQFLVHGAVRYRDIYTDEWRISEHTAELVFPGVNAAGVDPLSSSKLFHAFATLRTHGPQNTAR